MSAIGDIVVGQTFDTKFTTRQISGAPFTLAGSPVVSNYVGNSTTQLTAGITLTVDFDSVTGLNNVRVVATGGNGYATATDNQLVITTGTVNSVSVVGEVVAEYSIENRSALRPTTAGRTLVVDAAGLADANTVKLGPSGSGTAQTAKDVGGAVPAAAAGAANGLLISGSNSGTTTFGALTVTGTTTLAAVTTSGTVTMNAFTVSNATTLSGAVSLGSTLAVTGTTTLAAVNTGAVGTGAVTITGTLSTSGTATFNAFTISNALTISGATTFTGTVGMSNGMSIIGGSNTNALVLSAAAGGHGLLTQGNTTGHGISAIGGATGHGMKLLGGFTSGDGLNTQANGAGDGIEAVGTGGGFDINADIQGSLSGSVNSVVTGVTVSGTVTVGTNNDKTGYTLSAPGVTAVATGVWATVMTGATTAIEAMRGIMAGVLGKSSGLPLAPAYRDIADSKNVIVATTDTDGNRSAVTLDLT